MYNNIYLYIYLSDSKIYVIKINKFINLFNCII